MKKRITNFILFLIVLGGCGFLTYYTGQDAKQVMIYNFAVLGLMTLMYLVGFIGGMGKIASITRGLKFGTRELGEIFKLPGRAETKSLALMRDLFQQEYLDKKIGELVNRAEKSEEGIVDVEDYFNTYEIDTHIHKRLYDLAPEIFTSLGILGTFLGLVWGLKNFNPSDYQGMTTSVAMLVDGIKVAFLTSIYGISFSIVYTIGFRGQYSAMVSALSTFVEKFYTNVMPSAEDEARNILAKNQKLQVEALQSMTKDFSETLANSFQEVITPSFEKMNESLEYLSTNMIEVQKDAIDKILQCFLEEMKNNFKIEFSDFNTALTELKVAQSENAKFTGNIMKDFSDASVQFIKIANEVTVENQKIQKAQQDDYCHLIEYVKEAERSASKFWVACNQTMQKYLAQATEITNTLGTSQVSNEKLIETNTKVVNIFQKRSDEFMKYQIESSKVLNEVKRLLEEISAVPSNGEVSFTGEYRPQQKKLLDSLSLLEEKINAQNDLMGKMVEIFEKNEKSKSKFSLFR